MWLICRVRYIVNSYQISAKTDTQKRRGEIGKRSTEEQSREVSLEGDWENKRQEERNGLLDIRTANGDDTDQVKTKIGNGG